MIQMQRYVIIPTWGNITMRNHTKKQVMRNYYAQNLHFQCNLCNTR